ncbi:homeobox-leucine zipper protein HAT5-like [Punica granatum]|uniref:Homeobox-leucine zipper protein n=2 Tax=Punica granatum TaxID=22663 RepID=A0A218XWZ7_PUNGR|nr:homeobox-leucine zipper protein HAT5-like [Punica granatum]OWM89577.1 hypothetical protein CDL15_Pgr024325 [Punica granatum]PKI55987.1 hypothetical protein CRG98_023615 [Punica granatum]
MAGGKARTPASKSKASVKTDNGLLDSIWVPDSSTIFDGSNSMSDFESKLGGASTTPGPAFFQAGDVRNAEEDLELDGCFQLPGKKRRLSAHQVQFLERSFEVENRLEPERKAQLAKELGLQPRQVAIWFQNRRARFKTKQMEKDYDSLRACYDSLKANCDSLLKEKERLKHEVDSLKDKLLSTGECKEEENTCLKSGCQLHGEPQELNAGEAPKPQEDAASAKSDVFDSESPRLTEPGNSSQGLDPESSEIEDGSSLMISKSLLAPLSYFPKIEDGYNCSEPAMDYPSCTFGFSSSEDHPFWNWTY